MLCIMSNSQTFTSIYQELKSQPAPLLPPGKPHNASLTSQIASLEVHPTLEAALHILNLDLPAAHFLVRHMQSAPAFEGMFLHGMLHRMEGDYDNARMWYTDVKESEIYQQIWGRGKGFKEIKEEREEYGFGGAKEDELDAGQRFLNRVQALKVQGVKGGLSRGDLEAESRKEFDAVVEYCVEKFGAGRLVDARDAWVKNSEEISKMSEDQVNGNKGHRKF